RSRSRGDLTPRKTRSHGDFGLPVTTWRVRSRSRARNEGSSTSTTATFEPGLTPSLSRSGFVVSATDRSEDDHAEQPPRVGAGDDQHDQRDRVADAARQQAPEAHEGAEDERAGDAARGGTDQRRGRQACPQTSTTWRSLTAPVMVPEYTWLKKKRVPGWRRFSFPAASQLMWLKTSPGPVASTMATSAWSTSLSSGAVGSVSPEYATTLPLTWMR